MMERHEHKHGLRLVQPDTNAAEGHLQLSAAQVEQMRRQLLVTLARLREAESQIEETLRALGIVTHDDGMIIARRLCPGEPSGT